MSIVPTYKDGKELALITCDTCGAKEEVVCMHGTNTRTARKRSNGPKTTIALQNNKTVLQKLLKLKWKVYSTRQICGFCVDKAKEEKMVRQTAKIEKLEPNRKPSREQKREIMLMLQTVYDFENQRYTKSETDKTVADALGEGTLWGWVREIREDMFGPDGNEENMLTVGEAKLWIDRASANIEAFEKTITDMQHTLTQIKADRKEVVELLTKMQKAVK